MPDPRMEPILKIPMELLYTKRMSCVWQPTLQGILEVNQISSVKQWVKKFLRKWQNKKDTFIDGCVENGMKKVA
jgi:hypothetical protein